MKSFSLGLALSATIALAFTSKEIQQDPNVEGTRNLLIGKWYKVSQVSTTYAKGANKSKARVTLTHKPGECTLKITKTRFHEVWGTFDPGKNGYKLLDDKHFILFRNGISSDTFEIKELTNNLFIYKWVKTTEDGDKIVSESVAKR